MQEKKSIRKENKQKVATLEGNIRKEKEKLIFKKLEFDPKFIAAQYILLFSSLPDEVNTHRFIKKWQRKKNIYLPVVQGENLIIKAYNKGDKLSKGAFNILEPKNNNKINLEELDLIIVPGTAFDLQGNRMGRGKGYYDRLLKENKNYTIGICYAEQIVDIIPFEKHDVAMNKIIFA